MNRAASKFSQRLVLLVTLVAVVLLVLSRGSRLLESGQTNILANQVNTLLGSFEAPSAGVDVSSTAQQSVGAMDVVSGGDGARYHYALLYLLSGEERLQPYANPLPTLAEQQLTNWAIRANDMEAATLWFARAQEIGISEPAGYWTQVGDSFATIANHAAAIEAYLNALEYAEDRATWASLGVQYARQQMPDAAVKAFQNAIQLPADGASLSNIYYELGLVYQYQLGEDYYDLAAETYRQAILVADFEPESAIVHTYFQLGALHLLQGEWEQAIGYYQNTIALDLGHYDAHEQTARAYRAMGEPHQALLFAREATRLNAGRVEGHITLGLLLLDGGDLVGARQRFETALSIMPENLAGRHRSRVCC